MGLEELPLRQLDANLVYTFTYSGKVEVGHVKPRLYNDSGKDRVIKSVRASLGKPMDDGAILEYDIRCGYDPEYTPDPVKGWSLFVPKSEALRDDPTLEVRYAKPYVGGSGSDSDRTTHTSGVRHLAWGEGMYLTVEILSNGGESPGEDLTINVVVSE